MASQPANKLSCALEVQHDEFETLRVTVWDPHDLVLSSMLFEVAPQYGKRE